MDKETIEEYCPNAEFCIDPFYVVSWCTMVLDEIRREEWNKARTELAKNRRKRPGEAEQRAAANKNQRLNSVSRLLNRPSIYC